MHVLLIPSSYPHSYNRLSSVFFRDHALALQAAGHEVTVLAVVPVSIKVALGSRAGRLGQHRYDDDGLSTFAWEFLSVPKLRRVNNWLRVALGMKLYKTLQYESGIPDICHVHGFLAGAIAMRIKERHKTPFVLTEHNSAIPRNLLSGYQKKLLHRVVAAASACTAVSEWFANLLAAKTGTQFAVTPNPIPDVDHGVQPHREHSARNGGPALRLCSVARLDQNKRIDRLLHAFSTFVHEFPSSTLVIGGDGPERSCLSRLCKDLNISSSVTFAGRLPRADVLQLMSSSDLFVLSSDFETFGVVVAEALSLGVPAVSTRCGGPESIITSSELGELAEKSPASLCEAMKRVASRIVAGQIDHNAIAETARKRYSLQPVGSQFTEIFREVKESYGK